MVLDTFLFYSFLRLLGKLRAIFEATYTHAKNLAFFVFTYKALTGVLRELESQQKQYHSFIAALIGGYLVFGKNNKINEQVIYLLPNLR